MLLTDEYIKFMDDVQYNHNIKGDKYANADPEAELIKHYKMDKHLAHKIYEEWVALVFARIPCTKPED